MGRLGKRGKKPAAGGKEDTADAPKKKSEAGPLAWNKAAAKAGTEAFDRAGGFTEKDIEFMKKAIQVLCQSTNPLGRSIEFVTDDLDSMNKEFEHWRKESQSCQQKLKDEQKITEEVIQPLQDQLAEIEEKIREQTAKVNAVKS